MKNFFLYLLLWGGALQASAGTGIPPIREKSGIIPADTIPLQKKDIPASENKTARQQVPKGKPIKEVPRAKNQAKPKMVVSPSIKMKPVKIIKPKINGRGLGR